MLLRRFNKSCLRVTAPNTTKAELVMRSQTASSVHFYRLTSSVRRKGLAHNLCAIPSSAQAFLDRWGMLIDDEMVMNMIIICNYHNLQDLVGSRVPSITCPWLSWGCVNHWIQIPTPHICSCTSHWSNLHIFTVRYTRFNAHVQVVSLVDFECKLWAMLAIWIL